MDKSLILKIVGVAAVILGTVALAIAGVPAVGITGIVSAVVVVVGLVAIIFSDKKPPTV